MDQPSHGAAVLQNARTSSLADLGNDAQPATGLSQTISRDAQPGSPIRVRVFSDLDQALSPAAFWSPQHLVDSAWREHGPFAFWLTEALAPGVFVELGTHNGYSFLSVCQAVQRLGLSTACYAVDTWRGDEHAGFYGEDVHAWLSTTVEQNYSSFARLLRCRFDEALAHFADGSVDLLHIDGRHTFDDVVEDFESWRPKLSSRAIVLFHDTNVREKDFGVWKLWRTVSEQYPSFEFLHGHGLGVLACGAEFHERLRPLFQAAPASVSAIRAAYANLGGAISLRYSVENLGLGLAEARACLAGEVAKVAAARDETEELRQAHHTTIVLQESVQVALAAAREEAETLRTEHAARLAKEAAEAANARQIADNALTEARAEQHRLLADQEALRSAIATMSLIATEAQNRLAGLEQSTFWRASRPLRDAVDRMPHPCVGFCAEAPRPSGGWQRRNTCWTACASSALMADCVRRGA